MSRFIVINKDGASMMTIEESVIKDFTKDGWAECPLEHLNIDTDDEYCRVICPIQNICESVIKHCKDKRASKHK